MASPYRTPAPVPDLPVETPTAETKTVPDADALRRAATLQDILRAYFNDDSIVVARHQMAGERFVGRGKPPTRLIPIHDEALWDNPQREIERVMKALVDDKGG